MKIEDVVNAVLKREKWTLWHSTTGITVVRNDEICKNSRLMFEVRFGKHYMTTIIEFKTLRDLYEMIVNHQFAIYGYKCIKFNPYVGMTDEEILVKCDLEA